MAKLKCAWCGATVKPALNGKRPAQHKNGPTTCVGSGQLADTHRRIAKEKQRV